MVWIDPTDNATWKHGCIRGRREPESDRMTGLEPITPADCHQIATSSWWCAELGTRSWMPCDHYQGSRSGVRPTARIDICGDGPNVLIDGQPPVWVRAETDQEFVARFETATAIAEIELWIDDHRDYEEADRALRWLMGRLDGWRLIVTLSPDQVKVDGQDGPGLEVDPATRLPGPYESQQAL